MQFLEAVADFVSVSQAANRFKAAEMPSSTAEAASVPAAIAEEEEEGEEVDFTGSSPFIQIYS